jgi:hypothetical protein
VHCARRSHDRHCVHCVALFSSGFYRGNGTNIIKIAPESAVKFWAYESIKRMLCRDSSAPAIKEKLIAGSAAGAISQTAIYPLEITKTRLAVSAPGEYRGIMHCISSIIRTDGVSALFRCDTCANFVVVVRGSDSPTTAHAHARTHRGLLPSVVGVIPYAGVDFAVYSTLRDVYTRRYPNTHPGVLTVFVCGAVSSTCGQVVAYPLQLVRTRLQTQGTRSIRPHVSFGGQVPLPRHHRNTSAISRGGGVGMAGRPMLYNGMSDAFFKIWKCDGLLGTVTPHTHAHRTRFYLASRVCCVVWCVTRVRVLFGHIAEFHESDPCGEHQLHRVRTGEPGHGHQQRPLRVPLRVSERPTRWSFFPCTHARQHVFSSGIPLGRSWQKCPGFASLIGCTCSVLGKTQNSSSAYDHNNNTNNQAQR